MDEPRDDATLSASAGQRWRGRLLMLGRCLRGRHLSWRHLSWRHLALAAVALVVFAWALAPAGYAVSAVWTSPWHATPTTSQAGGLAVQDVSFAATDGTRLAGWLVLRSPRSPTVILVHGSKGSRVDMLPWARFLAAAGYNVLLYDSRGCGASAGWHITLGAHEPDDILGAAAYLEGRSDLAVKRFAALGVSLGAGSVLLAGARGSRLVAVVADSAWTDQHVIVNRLDTLRLGPLAVPTLPYGPAVENALDGADLSRVSPLAAIPSIAPRAVLLIHSADDANATTPLSGERALYAAAGQPKQEWIAPSGGHVGALAAHPADYQRTVLAFLARYVGSPSRP